MTLSFVSPPRRALEEEVAEVVRTAAPQRRRRAVASIRRRRVVGVLVSVTLLAFTAAGAAGSGSAWAVAAGVGALTFGYAGAGWLAARRAARRELAAAFRMAARRPADGRSPGSPVLDWAGLDPSLHLVDHGGLSLPPVAADRLTAGAVARFTASYLAALALTPFVAAIHVVRGDLSQFDPDGVVGRLVGFQGYWRSQRLRMLTVSVAATATVAVGGATSSAAFAASSYTVQPGDTLSAIAAANGTTVSALAAANDLGNPNFIVAGQAISLTPSGSPAAASGGTYTVQAGDTLSSIAAREGTTWTALASANGLSNPNLIFAGQRLTVPGGGVSAADVGSPAPVTTMAETWTETDTPPASTSEAPASSAPTQAAAVAVQTALAQVGKPYVYGGAGPDSFDCSGLVMYAYAAAGVSLPHYTVSQYDGTARISESQLQPGDIVFYDTGSGAQPGHEALYIGNGQVVAANTPGTSVQTQSVSYDGTPMGFGRVG